MCTLETRQGSSDTKEKKTALKSTLEPYDFLSLIVGLVVIGFVISGIIERSWSFFGEVQLASFVGAGLAFVIACKRLGDLGLSYFFGGILFALAGTQWVELPFQLVYHSKDFSNWALNNYSIPGFSTNGEGFFWLLFVASFVFVFRKYMSVNRYVLIALAGGVISLDVWVLTGFVQLQVVNYQMVGPTWLFVINAIYKVSMSLAPALLLKTRSN